MYVHYACKVMMFCIGVMEFFGTFLALVDKVYSYLPSLTLTDLKFWLVVGVGDLGVQEQLEGGVVLHLQSCLARNMEYTRLPLCRLA